MEKNLFEQFEKELKIACESICTDAEIESENNKKIILCAMQFASIITLKWIEKQTQKIEAQKNFPRNFSLN